MLPWVFLIFLGLVSAERSTARVSHDVIDLHPIVYGFGTSEPVGAQRYWLDEKTIYIDLSLVPEGLPIDHLWEVTVTTETASITTGHCAYSIGWIKAGDREDMTTFLKHPVRVGTIRAPLDSDGHSIQMTSTSILFLRGDELPANRDVDFIYVHVDSCFLSRYVTRYQFNRWNQGAYLMDWGSNPMGETWNVPAAARNTVWWQDYPNSAASNTPNSYSEGGMASVPAERDSTILKSGAGWWAANFYFNLAFFNVSSADSDYVLDLWFYHRMNLNLGGATGVVTRWRDAFCSVSPCSSTSDFENSGQEQVESTPNAPVSYYARRYLSYTKLFSTGFFSDPKFFHTVSQVMKRTTGTAVALPPYALMWDLNWVSGAPMLLQLSKDVTTTDCQVDTAITSANSQHPVTGNELMALAYDSRSDAFGTIVCGSNNIDHSGSYDDAGGVYQPFRFNFPVGVEAVSHPYLVMNFFDFSGYGGQSIKFEISGRDTPLFTHETAYHDQEDIGNPSYDYPIDVQIGLGVSSLASHQHLTISHERFFMSFQGFVPMMSGHRDLCANNGPCGEHGTCYPYYSTAKCVCNAQWTGETCSEDAIACDSKSCFNNGVCVDNIGAPGFTCNCSTFWTGDLCERASTSCPVRVNDEPMCLNGGHCINGPGGSFTCDCTGTSFVGDLCEKSNSRCSFEPLYCGAGKCVDTAATDDDVDAGFTCDCTGTGMTGPRCAWDPVCDPNPCKNRGACVAVDGVASCMCTSHFFGDHCEDTIEHFAQDCRYFDNTCGMHGTCAMNSLGQHRCECNSYWDGDYCDVHVLCNDEHNPCKNGGVCSVSHTLADQDQVTFCRCTGNWFGDHCDETLADYFDDCRFSASPCMHGGDCSVVDVRDGSETKYTCVNCDAGWYGEFCEMAEACMENNGGCMNGAVCSRGDDGTSLCACTGDFIGHHCEYKIEDFVKDKFNTHVTDCRFTELECMHEGECLMRKDGHFACVCGEESMYTGERCDMPKLCEPSPCMNGGLCNLHMDHVICICPGGWVGEHCEHTLNDFFTFNCHLKPCENGGTCTVNGECVCDHAKWAGKWCEVPVMCQTHNCHGGQCVMHEDVPSCICPGNLFGDSCQFNMDTGLSDCRTSGCMNGGSCAQFGNTDRYFCDCHTSSDGGSWTGDHCETSHSCVPNPCMNGGECFDNHGVAGCRCAGRWSGATCETSFDARFEAIETALEHEVGVEVGTQLEGSGAAENVDTDIMSTTQHVVELKETIAAIQGKMDTQEKEADAFSASIQTVYNNYARKTETDEIRALLDEFLSTSSTTVVSLFSLLVALCAFLL